MDSAVNDSVDDREVYGNWPFHTYEDKEQNRIATLQWLWRTRTSYTSHNKGLHLKINIAGDIVDYWPTTGCIKRNNKYSYCDYNYLATLATLATSTTTPRILHD